MKKKQMDIFKLMDFSNHVSGLFYLSAFKFLKILSTLFPIVSNFFLHYG